MENELLKLFHEIHGDISGSCYLQIREDEDVVRVMKDGNLCWTATKTDLMFDYIMKNLEKKEK